MKIDLLGLGMLSAVEECVDLIARTARHVASICRASTSRDPAVYAEIQAADTVGTFQIESRAQMQSLLQTRPENLDDLTVQVALIRPGPGLAAGPCTPTSSIAAHGAPIPDFVPPYDHPLLEPRTARDARRGGVPGAGARGRRWRWPASAPARPRRCGAR